MAWLTARLCVGLLPAAPAPVAGRPLCFLLHPKLGMPELPSSSSSRHSPILRSGLNRTEQQTLLSWKYLMQFLWNIISQLNSLVLINARLKTQDLKPGLKHQGFPAGSDGKASACNVGDLGLIPGSGRSPGEGNGNPL